MKNRNDLPAFLNLLGLDGIGVEVGVLRGDFSREILSKWHGRKLYSVDAWRHFGLQDVNDPDHNGHLNNFAHSFMSLYDFGERSVIIKDLSASAANLFQDESLDFVYIDAAHDYENVKKDVEVWFPKVKVGGIIAGHDYLNATKEETGHSLFEVKKAVDEFFEALNIKVNSTEETDYPSWWVRK
jgi:hypothetical protein